MLCPYYGEKSDACDLDLTYIITLGHLQRFCCSSDPEGAYKNCDKFVQLSPRETKKPLRGTVLEMKAIEEEDPNPMATFEGHNDSTVQMHFRVQERLSREPSEEKDLTAKLYPKGWL